MRSPLEERREDEHKERGDSGGDKCLPIDKDAAGKNALEDKDRRFRKAEADLVDVTAPDGLAEAVEEVGNAERGHEQDDGVLVDQRPQDQPFDRVGEQDHDPDRDCHSRNEGHVLREPRH